MRSNIEDTQHRLIYINGSPYLVSPAFMQSSGQGGGQLSQVFLPLSPQTSQQRQQQSPQQDAISSGYVVASMPSAARHPPMTCLPISQAGQPSQSHGPLTPSQLIVLHAAPPSQSPATVELPASSTGQTWVPALASHPRSSHVARPNGGQLPSYHAVVPPATAAVALEGLQSVNVVSLPASGAAAAPAAPGLDGLPLPDTPLHSPPSAGRQRGQNCLQRLSIHQRGTARLFVGQIHYDACEDDLYQIFGVYGHVLDVKIMRGGESNAAQASAGAGAGAPVAATCGKTAVVPPLKMGEASVLTASAATTAAVHTTASTPATAIVGQDSCNDSSYLNLPKIESESSSTRGAVLTMPPPALSPSAIAAVSVQAVMQLPSNINSVTNSSSPVLMQQRSNRRCNAFVTFSSMIEADTAISALHGRYVMGRDRPLQVTYCQATENISQFGFAHAVRLHQENRNNPLPLKSGAPTHR